MRGMAERSGNEERGSGTVARTQRRDAMRNRGKRKRAANTRAESCARGARQSGKGEKERGGETGERDETQIQKVLTS